MWFLGLIVGAAIGAIGGSGGAFLGALIGLFAGLAISKKSPVVDDTWNRNVDDALRQILQRIETLERRAGATRAQAESAPTPAAPSAPEPAAAPAPAITVAEAWAAEIAGVNVAPAPAATVPASGQEPMHASRREAAEAAASVDTQSAFPEPSDTRQPEAPGRPETHGRTQLIGAAIGGLLGLFGGFIGFATGALVGWVIALIVIANQGKNIKSRPEPRREDESARGPSATPDGAEESVRAPTAPEYPGSVAPSGAYESPAAPYVAPAEPAPETGPGWLQRLVSGNIVAKIGVIILFFGIGFLLKYAYDHALLPVPLRLAGVAVVGFGMMIGGWRLRDSRRLYGLILQGGGIGVLYLDVFFALRIYGLLDVTAGFAAFMTLGVMATLLAVRQDAKVLAVLGLTGAFLAPVLAGSKTENHVLLFSYYTLLNGFILTISWFKAWRDLNLVGFIFTFVVGLLWGARNYRPELFASVEPFVLIFFAMYLVIPILFAHRQPPELKGLVDGTLVFGTPLATAFMQAGLVKGMPYGLAWSAGCAAALYALLAGATIRRDGMRVLGETYVALSVVFLTFAIFFAFDAYPTFALWTLEGAAVVWVGLRQRRLLARLFGLGLQLAGAFYFLVKYPDYRLADPWFNDFVLGCVIIAAAGFIIARLMHRYHATLDRNIEPSDGLIVAWAGLWWTMAGVHSLYYAYPSPDFPVVLLAFFAASFAMVELIGARLQWAALRQLSHAHVVALFLVAALLLLPYRGFLRPLANGGYWAWPLNFVILFWAYRRQLGAGLLTADSVRYAAAWWLIGGLATWDVAWLVVHRDYWGVLGWGGVGMAAAALRFWRRERGNADAAGYSTWILAWGIVWWFVGGSGLIERYVGTSFHAASHLGFAAASFLVAEWLGRPMEWRALRALTVAHVPAMIGIMLLTHSPGAQPLGGGALAAWPVSFGVLYWTLHRQLADGIATAYTARYWTGWVLMFLVATREVIWQLDHERYAWALGWSALGMLAGYARFRLRERDNAGAAPISVLALAWGMCFWFASGFAWIDSEFAVPATVTATLGFIAASFAAFEVAGGYASWPAIRRTVVLLPAAMAIALIAQYVDRSHPFAAYGWLAWLAGFLTLYSALLRQERAAIAFLGGAQHVLTFWLGVLVLTWEAAWQLHSYGIGSAWAHAAWSVVPALALGGVSAFSGRSNWPFGARYTSLYRGVALAPVAVVAAVWALYLNLTPPGSMAPLPYLPVLNPIDAAQIAVLLALQRWGGTFGAEPGVSRSTQLQLLGAFVFLWVNCIALRSIHFWAGVDYRFDALFNSVLVQAVFSLLWTISALVLMLYATRSVQRKLWIAGAALLAVAVVKLFLLDLANSGTVERIVSFIGVGAGLLAIGYVAPVPPGDKEQQGG